MKIIIGLGNPGKQYENTRHNVGFMILDRLKYIAHFSEFEMNEKFNSLIAKGKDSLEEKTLLVKPMLFMNRSGEVVRDLIDFYKIPIENIYIIHDDLDINLGEYRRANDSSAAGHNGVQDIMDKLSTQNLVRFRVGIEGAEKREARTISGDVFVLQKFTAEELQILENSGISGGIAADLKL